MSAVLTEVRCPAGPQHLSAKLRSEGGRPVIKDGNLIEFACRDCRTNTYKMTGLRPIQVLHRYNLAGDLVETEVVGTGRRRKTCLTTVEVPRPIPRLGSGPKLKSLWFLALCRGHLRRTAQVLLYAASRFPVVGAPMTRALLQLAPGPVPHHLDRIIRWQVTQIPLPRWGTSPQSRRPRRRRTAPSRGSPSRTLLC